MCVACAGDHPARKASKDQRAKDHEAFVAEQRDHSESIDALDRAINVLQKQNYDRTALLQLQESAQLPANAQQMLSAFIGMMGDEDCGGRARAALSLGKVVGGSEMGGLLRHAHLGQLARVATEEGRLGPSHGDSALRPELPSVMLLHPCHQTSSRCPGPWRANSHSLRRALGV